MNKNTRDTSTAEIRNRILDAFRIAMNEIGAAPEEEFVFVLEEEDTLIWHHPKTKVAEDC